jgi:DNA gyrase inhibitor GyrI
MKKVFGIVLAGFMAFSGVALTQDKKEPAAGVLTAQVPAAADSVRLVPSDPYFYCAMEMKGSYEKHGTAFQGLYQAAGTQGLPMTAVPFGIYWNSPRDTPVDSLRWELGFALPETRTLAAPLTLKKWEFPLTATLSFEGAFGSEAQTAAYLKLFAWIGQNGYKPAGPLMEKFVTMPVQDAQGRYNGKVEILIPVARTK